MANKTVDLNTVIQSVQEIIDVSGTSMFKVPSKVNPFDLQNLGWLNVIERNVVVEQMNTHFGSLSRNPMVGSQLSKMAVLFPRHTLNLTSDKDGSFRGTFSGWVIRAQSFERGKRESLVEVCHKDYFTYGADFTWGDFKGTSRSRDIIAYNENFERFASLATIEKALRDLVIQLKLLV